MKRCFFLMACATLLFAFTACGADEQTRAVISMIESIGDVALYSESEILEAENALRALTDRQRENVNNSVLLLDARNTLDELLEREHLAYLFRVQYLSELQEVYTEIQSMFTILKILNAVVIDVWQVAINTRNVDFNDALGRLYEGRMGLWGGTVIIPTADAAEAFRTLLDEAIAHNEMLNATITNMNNPPDEYRDLYTAIVNLYSSARALLQHVESPSGNIRSFSDGRNAIIAEINQQITVLEITHPEITRD